MTLPPEGITLELVNREWLHDGGAHAEEMADSVWVPVYSPDASDFFSRSTFLERLRGYAAGAGFQLAQARSPAEGQEPGSLVAFGYAFALPPNSRWMASIRTERSPDGGRTLKGEPLPAALVRNASTYAICDIIVAPEWQGRGLGRALHDLLVSGPGARRADKLVLGIEPANADSLRLFRDKLGYQQIGWTYPYGREYMSFAQPAARYRRLLQRGRWHLQTPATHLAAVKPGAETPVHPSPAAQRPAARSAISPVTDPARRSA